MTYYTLQTALPLDPNINMLIRKLDYMQLNTHVTCLQLFQHIIFMRAVQVNSDTGNQIKSLVL